ncbi:MAG TPA: SUMF1/EgtB/PvdO family nonheme iron enzyme [Kofleriaceae bacterium]
MMGRLAVLVLAACGSQDAPPKATPVGDATAFDAVLVGVPGDASSNAELISRLRDLSPREPAPKPLVRKHHAGDCSSKYAPRSERDSNPMCRIEGGTFEMGGTFPNSPPHIVSSRAAPVKTSVGAFDIDQFEVTAPQVALFLNAHGNDCPGLHLNNRQRTPCVWFDSPQGLEERDGRFVVLPEHQRMVVGGFSAEGAMRYCAWVGKQLVTSAQWEYAARHDPKTGRDLIYPWGDSWLRDRTCTMDTDCRAERRRYNSVAIAGMFDGTRGRGDGSSPYGVHDTVEGAPEFVVSCSNPNDTCHPGTVCQCQVSSTAIGQFDPTLATTFARFDDFPYGAVRCVVPR